MKGRAFSSSRSAIISLLLDQGELSRVDIARQTGLSRAAISLRVAELIEEGVVQEIGTSNSTGGRKPVLLRLGGATKLVVGGAFEDDSLYMTLVNLDGQQLDHLRIPHVSAHDPRVAVRTVVSGVRALLADRMPTTLLGVGISLSGQVNSSNDMFRSAVWAFPDTPLRTMLEDALGVPAIVLDNAHAAGLGDFWLNGREHREHLIYLYIGIGIGGAIVANRELYVGRNGTAGEIGAMIVDPGGQLFSDSRRGSLGGFLTADHLLSVIEDLRQSGTLTSLPSDIPESEFAKKIADAAEQGDDAALAVIEYAARWVGHAVGNLINILNPDEVVLGGPYSQWGESFASGVTRFAEETALATSFAGVTIRIGNPVASTIPLGAAAAIIQRAPDLLAPTASDRAELREPR